MLRRQGPDVETFLVTLLATCAVLICSALAADVIATFLDPPPVATHLPETIPYGQRTAVTLMLCAPVLIAATTPYAGGFGAAAPRRPRAVRFLTAAALTWLALGAAGMVNIVVRDRLGQPAWSGTLGDGDRVFAAVTAGIGEEAVHLAVPTGLVYLAGVLVNIVRRRRGKDVVSGGRIWLVAATVGPGVALASRAAGHLYQGPVSAVLAVAWGAGLIAVFVWVRSIWPIMLGHTIYDLPTHYETWEWTITHFVGAPLALALLGLLVVRGPRPLGET